MKKIITTIVLVCSMAVAFAQGSNKIVISFNNTYKDVYHLALIIYTPDGKNETRVSNLEPGETKQYQYPEGTALFIANLQQEAYAMKGNDIKTSGIKPYIMLQKADDKKIIKLADAAVQKNINTVLKPNANDALGTWVIDLRPTPESELYLKDFKFTKVEGKKFDGEFYGYPFEGGLLNTDWDKIYFAFTTSDQSGTYYHSGYIEGNKIYGMSLNENRKLLLPWKGEKKN